MPTDLNLHCLQRQSISGFSRTRVNVKEGNWNKVILICNKSLLTSPSDQVSTYKGNSIKRSAKDIFDDVYVIFFSEHMLYILI